MDPGALKRKDRKRLAAAERERVAVLARVRDATEALPIPPEPPLAEGGPHVGRPADPLENRWGLVWRDAAFEGAGQTARSEPKGRDRRAARNAVWLVKILEEGDDYAIVQAGARRSFDQHCASAQAMGQDYGLWFVVDRADFVPVLRHAVDIEHAGAVHRIERGAPVFPQGVLVDEFVVDLPVPEDALGWWYSGQDLPERTGEVQGSVAGSSIRIPGAQVRHLPPGYTPDGRVKITALDGGVGRWEGRCGVLTVHTDETPTADSYLLGALSGRGADEPKVRIQAGTPIFAPDGPLAGVLTGAISPNASALSGDGRQCMTLEFGDQTFGGDPHRGTPITLCFEAADLRPE